MWLSIWIFTFLIPSVTTMSRVRVSYIPVQLDGIINTSSQLPTCGDTARINLLSYEYLHRICTPGSICINNRTGNLSASAEFLIHESCSYKQACVNISIPISDLQTHNYNTIYVTYECIDLTSFIDVCSKTEVNINSMVHLVSNENSTFMKGCECRVDGLFSLTLSDVRLNAKDTELCSPAVISIQYLTSSREFSCNNRSESYDSVFHHAIETVMPRATIAFETRSRTVSPEMVWLILAPKTSLKLQCSYFPRIDEPTRRLSDSVPTVSSMSSSYSGDDGIVKITTIGVTLQKPKYGEHSPVDTGIIVGLSVAGSCIALSVVGICIYKCRKRTSEQRQSGHQTGQDTPVSPVGQEEPFL